MRPESGREELADRLRAHFAVLGHKEVESGPCDREVVIVGHPSGSWLSIYDSALESADARVLDEVGPLVSGDGFGPAVGVLVFDSDLLEMKLYRGSATVARFSNWPSYFAAGRKPANPKLDNPGEWLALTPQYRKPSELRAAWRISGLESAEPLLARVAQTFGW